MSEQTFIWCPSYEPVEQRQPRVRQAQFREGWSDQANDGINTSPETWTLTFENSLGDEAAAIVAFLSEHGGWRHFLWKPPSGEWNAYLCAAWRKRQVGPNRFSLDMTFEQKYVFSDYLDTLRDLDWNPQDMSAFTNGFHDEVHYDYQAASEV